MMKEMKIWNSSKGWMAENLIDGQPDGRIIKLFGTHILPTGFTSQCPKQTAIAELQKLNPDYIIGVVQNREIGE